MNDNRDRHHLESVDMLRETTINKQLRQIYLDQERRRKAHERRRQLLEKWGYLCSCCTM